MSTFQTMVLHDAFGVANTLNNEVSRSRLARVQRYASFRIESTMRTMLKPVVLAIIRITLLQLLLFFKEESYKSQIEIDKDTAKAEECSWPHQKLQETVD